MSDRQVITIWAGIFATVSSIAWAIAIGSIYSPKIPQDAKQICATYSEARNTAFCMEIAKQ